MYKIAICDDDERFNHHLHQQVIAIMEEANLLCGRDFDISSFYDATSLLDHIIKENMDYQLLLLDIEISKENGLELARAIRAQQMTCGIIYITAYRDYVFDCFDTQPLWYLLKPVDFTKLKEILLANYHRNYADVRLFLKIEGRLRSIPYTEIYALESTQHRTRIWLQEGCCYWNGALSALKSQLPSIYFCQSHNSYILNLQHVKEIQRMDALMDDGRSFPISRRYHNSILDQYFTFLKL